MLAKGARVRQELVRHGSQRDLGEVELMPADEGEEQVEGTGEYREVDVEARIFFGRALDRHRHASTPEPPTSDHKPFSRGGYSCSMMPGRPGNRRGSSTIARAAATPTLRSTS